MNILATTNLPLTIVLIVILVAIVATVIAMIVLGVRDKKKRSAQPAQEEATAEEPAPTEEPKAEEPVEEEPVEEAVAEPATEDAIAEEPVAEEPVEAPVEAPKKTPSKPKAKPTPKAEPATSTAEPVEKAYAGKWVIYRTEYDAFAFELRASNGEMMLRSSSPYTTVSGAKNGIKTYKTNISKGHFIVEKTKTGDFIFRLYNGNGQLLAFGSDYKTKARCESAIESTKRFAETALIEVAD